MRYEPFRNCAVLFTFADSPPIVAKYNKEGTHCVSFMTDSEGSIHYVSVNPAEMDVVCWQVVFRGEE